MRDRLCKLWIYTNLNCNLSCGYCVAESNSRTPARALSLATVQQLVDEAVALHFRQLFFTGGEPFLLKDIYPMLEYASARAETVVLTNGLLLDGRRLERLIAIANRNLTIQVSLDGARPEHQDPYRGSGTWAGTVEAIHRLRRHGIGLRLSSTITPCNANHLDEVIEFRRSLGLGDDDHVIRPLARRGFSTEGVEVDIENLLPEITVNADGVFWHPLASPSALDLKISDQLFPLEAAVKQIEARLEELTPSRGGRPQALT